MHRLIDFSLRNKFIVLIFTAVMVGVGFYSMTRLPIDAVPDVTPNQVLILTQAPGLGPVEVERFITFPVETAMSGLPGITDIRSVSRFGLSSVYVYFDERTDVYFARRLVLERLPDAREAIPAGFGSPTMGPITTGLGEIYQFEVKGAGMPLMDLRSILEWDIAFKLRSVPGVVEVNSYGGELKTYEVQLDPEKLVSFNVSLETVFNALERNNANAGGAYIERAQEQYVIRGEGLVEKLSDIDNIVVAAEQGTPVYIKNLGRTVLAPRVRQGAVTRDGRGEVVTGVVMMLMGENSRVVAQRIAAALEKIKPTLPKGVEIDSYYDRTALVRKTISTVEKNLIEGGVLVIAVLLLLLGNVRGGLIVASAIPLSMLFAFTGMVQAGLSGQPDESRRDRLRPDRRRLGGHDREHRPQGQRAPRTRRVARGRDSRGRARGRAPGIFRRPDHHDRLPADPDARGRRGQDVPADGAHRGVCAHRLADSRADRHARPGVAAVPRQGQRARAVAGSLAQGALSADSRSHA